MRIVTIIGSLLRYSLFIFLTWLLYVDITYNVSNIAIITHVFIYILWAWISCKAIFLSLTPKRLPHRFIFIYKFSVYMIIFISCWQCTSVIDDMIIVYKDEVSSIRIFITNVTCIWLGLIIYDDYVEFHSNQTPKAEEILREKEAQRAKVIQTAIQIRKNKRVRKKSKTWNHINAGSFQRFFMQKNLKYTFRGIMFNFLL